MTQEFHCGDLMPGCNFVAKADTEDHLMKKVAMHANIAHNIVRITPEMAKKVRATIRTVAEAK